MYSNSNEVRRIQERVFGFFVIDLLPGDGWSAVGRDRLGVPFGSVRYFALLEPAGCPGDRDRRLVAVVDTADGELFVDWAGECTLLVATVENGGDLQDALFETIRRFSRQLLEQQTRNQRRREMWGINADGRRGRRTPV